MKLSSKLQALFGLASGILLLMLVYHGGGPFPRTSLVPYSSVTFKHPSVLTSTPPHISTSYSANISTTQQTISTQELPTFFPSKELFVRAIYFDDRERNGHKNSSVFLVVVKKSITDQKLIVGCQIDDKIATDFEVRLIGETPLWRHFYPKINHEEAFVECFDLPAKNGSNGYIHFKQNWNSSVELAASERPLLVRQLKVPPTTAEGKKYGFTIATCAKVFGSNPPWLKEWLLYQRALGVQHVHLDAEDTFKLAGWLEKPFIKEVIKEGFLSIDIWNKYLSTGEIWYHNQGLIYEDCLYRLQGVYDYLILMDTDDFLTPRNPKEKQLHYYINKYCRGENIGSCKFKWIEYYPDHFGLNKSIPIPDGNVTKQLTNYSHYIQGNPKSLHRANVIIDAATHYAYKMVKGYVIKPVSMDVMYAAHMRKNNRLAGKQQLHIGLPHANGCMQHTMSLVVLMSDIVMLLCVRHFIT